MERGLWELIGVMVGSTFMKREARELICVTGSPPLLPCDDTTRRPPSASQAEDPSRKC